MIIVRSQDQPYLAEFTNGSIVSTTDTTVDKGGGNRGFRPHDLLEAAVASCMNISIRMAAKKHQIELAETTVTVVLDRSAPDIARFTYRIEIDSQVSDRDRQTLLAEIETCPVRNTLGRSISFHAATTGAP